MSTIRIQTTQHTELEYTLAGLGNRLIAYLIDLIIYIAYGIAALLVLSSSNGLFDRSPLSSLLFFLPIFFYQLLCEVLMNGQSVGKRFRSIKVISLDGHQPSFGQYLIRWLFRIVDDMIGSGIVAIVTIAVSEKGQRLGDLLAGTTVVHTKPSTVFGDILFGESEPSYEPVFPQVIRLKDGDVRMLKEVIRRVRLNPARHQAVLDKAFTRTLALLSVQTNLSPIQFLETVVKDHSHITAREGEVRS